ncbi:unnamed protein product [Linum trigynum]|uniref:Uncharacterized protein n=1 Tax=Linum trigynum TaxID=586398 RepID=A0AAV2C8Z4_9ROSI
MENQKARFEAAVRSFYRRRSTMENRRPCFSAAAPLLAISLSKIRIQLAHTSINYGDRESESSIRSCCSQFLSPSINHGESPSLFLSCCSPARS